MHSTEIETKVPTCDVSSIHSVWIVDKAEKMVAACSSEAPNRSAMALKHCLFRIFASSGFKHSPRTTRMPLHASLMSLPVLKFAKKTQCACLCQCHIDFQVALLRPRASLLLMTKEIQELECPLNQVQVQTRAFFNSEPEYSPAWNSAEELETECVKFQVRTEGYERPFHPLGGMQPPCLVR